MRKSGDMRRRGINSIEVGLELLNTLAIAGRPCSLTEIARASKMSPSRAHSYLASFLRSGMVSQDPETARYKLGRMALLIGISALQQLDIVETARLPLSELRDEFGQTVSLSIWGNLGPTVVRWFDGARPLLTDAKIGTVMPLLWSTIGHVFLAYLPRNRTEPFIERELRREGKSGETTDRKTAQAIVAEVMRTGVATREAPPGASHGEIFQPTRAISAPIFRADRTVEGVVTLVGSVRAVDIDPDGPMVRAVKETAARITAELGGTSAASAAKDA